MDLIPADEQETIAMNRSARPSKKQSPSPNAYVMVSLAAALLLAGGWVLLTDLNVPAISPEREIREAIAEPADSYVIRMRKEIRFLRSLHQPSDEIGAASSTDTQSPRR